MNTLTGKGLSIDIAALGNTMMLIGVSPYYRYENNVRTDQVLGYKYTVILTERNYEQLDVKIEGKKVMDCKAGESFKVVFNGLKVTPYVQVRNNGYAKLAFTASADSVEEVD